MELIIGIIAAIVRTIGLILFVYYGWVVVVGILGYLIWQNKRRQKWVNETDQVLLLVEVPKDNDKKELSAEQMFASLHGILRPRTELVKEGSLQEHISFEIASVGNQIQFYVWTPRHLKDFVEGQIYAQYPGVQIKEGVEDYVRSDIGERVLYGTELILTKPDVVPIKTFTSFEVDPLAGITAPLSKLEESGEEAYVQIIARPIDDTWQDRGVEYIERIKSGGNPDALTWFLNILLSLPVEILKALVGPGGDKDKGAKKEDKKEAKLSTVQDAVVKGVGEKIGKLGYQVKVRILYLGPDQTLAKQRLQAIVGGFKQFNTTSLNGFTTKRNYDSEDFLTEYRARLFLDPGHVLNIEELASLYHLPHTNVETPNMVWTTSKTGEPPPNLPSEETMTADDISLFGLTTFRGGRIKFGIKRTDRARHLYIIGQTGTGKSHLLQLLALSDLYHDHGMAIIDPHGDLTTDMMQFVPPHRLKDVIYFNPTDRDFPIAFNPMELTDPNFKHDTASELVGVMHRMFESWGPRLEHILRFTILALLDYPNATMLGITRMLTEKEFRKRVVRQIQDPVVKAFWVNEFAGWNDKFANEAVAPVLNKVGAFIANPLIRNVIGQPKSTIDLREVMDEGKILLVNLSHGQIGEVNAGVLGALIVTKIQLAAMSRADIPKEQRRPFYLYVDEFQNFATDSFAVILSEARKYALNLTVANQYISQMPETVREAVFGNVGSMISFRVGAADSTFLAKYFEPSFEAPDLVKMHNYNAFISMSIDGERTIPFSAMTLRMPEPQQNQTEQIISQSRERYAAPRAEVEEKILRWSRSNLDDGTSDSNQPTEPLEEQKPNMLQALKNPEHSNRPEHRPNRGDSRDRNRYRSNQPANRYAGNRPPENNEANTSQPAKVAEGQRQAREVRPDQEINLRQ